MYNSESGVLATIYFFVAHTHAKAGFYETDERKKPNRYGDFCTFVPALGQRAGFDSRKTGSLREKYEIKGGVQRKSERSILILKKLF